MVKKMKVVIRGVMELRGGGTGEGGGEGEDGGEGGFPGGENGSESGNGNGNGNGDHTKPIDPPPGIWPPPSKEHPAQKLPDDTHLEGGEIWPVKKGVKGKYIVYVDLPRFGPHYVVIKPGADWEEKEEEPEETEAGETGEGDVSAQGAARSVSPATHR